jgi:ferredoxin-NADP reductase
MLAPTASVALGVAFVLLGGINVWLVLEAWSRVKAAKARARMLTLHRIGGYLFLTLFCVMTYYMTARLRDGVENSATVTLHLALAMMLSPLLFLKTLIARYYKNHHNLLLPLGLTIFVLAFVLVASTAGPYLSRASRVEQVSIPTRAQPLSIDLNLAGDLMQKRCAKCHNLDRVIGARKDAQGWAATVDRMRALPGSGITESEAQAILSYLTLQNRPDGSASAAKKKVARALVDQRCARCHNLDRVYKTVQTPEQWRETVTRMVEYAAGSAGALQTGEDQQIIDYLSATQTPQAAGKRKAEADAAISTGRSLIASNRETPASVSLTASSRYDGRAVAFISIVCLVAAILVIRRPGVRVAPSSKPTPPLKASPPAPAGPPSLSTPFLLQLVKITQHTPDTKTLRFAVRSARELNALPGQFLTFSFLFDGRRERRCYSICSSAARSGYVEITPKRMKNGCVSVFLNDRASIGLTVEASGPFGKFCLKPAEDRNIVLIAAGSGITPLIGMLRYIDDLCLDTHATLLYCVRTAKDIIFRSEIEELHERLQNFRCHIVLSQPDSEWKGARGHISREFLLQAVPDVQDRVFFLCGPLPFMEVTLTILTELGVESQRIRQEIFGGAGALSNAAPSLSLGSGAAVEFARSGRMGTAVSGQTLLEVAAAAGVDIPSACRQGQCGTCKTRLLEGRVEMSTESGLDAESKAMGFVLTCVGRAAGGVRLDA